MIAGGGPAGLAAAIALRQRGADVLVADALEPPIDKPCGEGLMPDSRRDLARLGVELTTAHGAEFRGILFAGSRRRRCRGFSPGPGAGRAPPCPASPPARACRSDMACALRLEVTCRHQATTSEWRSPAEHARIAGLIGADGHASRVRSWAGLDAGSLAQPPLRFSCAFPRRSLEPVCRDPLGRARSGLHHACRAAGGLRRRHHPPPGRASGADPRQHFPFFRRNWLALPSPPPSAAHLPLLAACAVSPVATSPSSGTPQARPTPLPARVWPWAFVRRSCSPTPWPPALSIFTNRAMRRSLRSRSAWPLSCCCSTGFPSLRDRTLSAFAHRPQLFREMLAVHVGKAPFPPLRCAAARK